MYYIHPESPGLAHSRSSVNVCKRMEFILIIVLQAVKQDGAFGADLGVLHPRLKAVEGGGAG